MQKDLSPILLFVYNRPQQTRKTLESLAKNTLADQSTLYIFSDGPADVEDLGNVSRIDEVRQLITEKKWCKEVVIYNSEKNKGLATSIIEGVTEKVNQYGKVIVLEDDLVTARGFLEYMNASLERYQLENRVMHISGFQFPIRVNPDHSAFFLPITSSWGWGTWKRAWDRFDPECIGYEKLKTDDDLRKKFDLNGTFLYSKMIIDQMETKNIDSWAIRWYWAVFKHNGLSLVPDKSLVLNNGYGKGATHTKGRNPFKIEFDADYYVSSLPDKISVNEQHFLSLQNLYKKLYPAKISLVGRIIRKIRREIHAMLDRD
ncbi:glycosyltransferase [Dyadobacter sp. CY347]|uniref:glycosyltransferase n=1 Tax=Dyadobacter sp. CY347 TaxID=2909336 RepID=UPI001F249F6F|nr:glycosyltransferase [Dyadobacter sp. CY347]MCF2491095.1 glycosyltransferase [Dyadobacter sp. CY347]